MHSFLLILGRSGQVDSMKPLYQDYLVIKVWSDIFFSSSIYLCAVLICITISSFQLLHSIRSGHRANIFSAKFLPGSGDKWVSVLGLTNSVLCLKLF